MVSCIYNIIYYYILSCSMDCLYPAQRLQCLQHLVDIQRDIAEFDGAIAQVVQAIEGGLSGSVLGF